MIDYVESQVAFPELDVRQRLSVSSGYGVAELQVREDGAFVGRSLGECGLDERDIRVLTLERGTTVIPNPKAVVVLEANDRLLCFGSLAEMRTMVSKRRPRRRRLQRDDSIADTS